MSGRVLDDHDEAFMAEAFRMAQAVNSFCQRISFRHAVEAGIIDADEANDLIESNDRMWLIRTQRIAAARTPKETSDG